MTPLPPNPLLERLREAASAEGFSLFGITPAVTSQGHSQLVEWIDEGYAGEMQYISDRRDAYRHPESILDRVRSIIALAYPYDAGPSRSLPAGHGKIARYVWNHDDYHDTLHPKLKRLCRVIVDSESGARARGVVDTAPLAEREIAQLAGLGWRGKNTLLLNQQLGSYFFLACVLTDVELPCDTPHESSHCGTCTACIDACPTDAFPSPGVLDATRCISYLTIEHRGSIALEHRAGISDWLFGCDICQEVCPWNRKPSRRATVHDQRLEQLNLRKLFEMSEEQFRERFRKTPLWRSRRRGILRNAAIVLGNQGDVGAIDALAIGLNDEEPVVRSACAWALGRIGGEKAYSILVVRRRSEPDEEVCNEIDLSINPHARD